MVVVMVVARQLPEGKAMFCVAGDVDESIVLQQPRAPQLRVELPLWP